MRSDEDQAIAVVLAAGHGQRMQPITSWIPKPLVSIDGCPILISNVKHLYAAGFRRIYVVYGRPTSVIPDFLATTDLAGAQVECVFQKEQRGTGDALLTAMNACGDFEHCLLMVGDTLYPQGYIADIWSHYACSNLDACLLLKELPFHQLARSSLVVLDDRRMVRSVIPKPAPNTIRSHKSRLADASLHVYGCLFKDYLERTTLSGTGELEIAGALSNWIADGGRVGGLVRPVAQHVTTVQDFVIHNLPFGRRLVALSEIERAIDDASDEDISGHVRSLSQDDLPFAYRRLKALASQPMDHIRRARTLAIISELLRVHACPLASAAAHCSDDNNGTLSPIERIARLEQRLEDQGFSPEICHHLAVSYARYSNEIVSENALAAALSRAVDTAQSTHFAQMVTVDIPARIAFSSSQGSDLSYVIEEKSAVILNCAIKVGGQYPGHIVIERIPEKRVDLWACDNDARASITDFDDLLAPVACDDRTILLRSGLRFSGIVTPERYLSLEQWLASSGGGFRVELRCSVRQGSGLGCSAILAAGLIRGLRDFAGLETSMEELLARAYCCERSYGRSGYQDVIGGAMGGMKLIQADATTGLFAPKIERIELVPELCKGIREHLLIFYTGRPHLNSPYLLTIPAKYFTRSGDYLFAYENGKQLTYAMAKALHRGDWKTMGNLVSEYWDDREYFEEGVTPDSAAIHRERLKLWSHGTALCGSGHGGYMMVVLREGCREDVTRYLRSCGVQPEDILDFEIAEHGIQSHVDGAAGV
ncbi:MAG: NTP transferase domain-containing protein [Armatimonadetes bacterium]|nr:NTP transferase domain-containing protein [Armatimonadota bacterium]